MNIPLDIFEYIPVGERVGFLVWVIVGQINMVGLRCAFIATKIELCGMSWSQVQPAMELELAESSQPIGLSACSTIPTFSWSSANDPGVPHAPEKGTVAAP